MELLLNTEEMVDSHHKKLMAIMNTGKEKTEACLESKEPTSVETVRSSA
jgi:hypothetical protein